jgi:hypothetical protein
VAPKIWVPRDQPVSGFSLQRVYQVVNAPSLLVSLADVLIALTLAKERLLKRAAHSIPFVLGANHLAVFKRVKAN